MLNLIRTLNKRRDQLHNSNVLHIQSTVEKDINNIITLLIILAISSFYLPALCKKERMDKVT